MSKLLRKQILEQGDIPNHIAIIMDGNGRWASSKNLPRISGHQEGINSVREIVQICGELEISHLTLYTFQVMVDGQVQRTYPEFLVIKKESILYAKLFKFVVN